jgi:hypothetical protein
MTGYSWLGSVRPHVLGEVLKCRQILGWAGSLIAFSPERVASRLFRCPVFEKDSLTQIPDLLQRGIGSAGILVDLS